jgi:hypothetical protein
LIGLPGLGIAAAPAQASLKSKVLVKSAWGSNVQWADKVLTE